MRENGVPAKDEWQRILDVPDEESTQTSAFGEAQGDEFDSRRKEHHQMNPGDACNRTAENQKLAVARPIERAQRLGSAGSRRGKKNNVQPTGSQYSRARRS